MGCTQCTVYVCTSQDMVQCVSQATSSVSPCVCFVAGALRGIHAEALLPPYPKGWISAAASPVTWTDLLGARAERVPDSSSYLSRIPWKCSRQWVVNPPARLPWIARRASRSTAPSDAPLHALLNASAAGESTTAGRS